MPYVNQRWLGGMLTNFQTVFKRLERLKELEDLEQTGALVSLSKKEQLVLSREKAKLERSLGGIRDMKKVPSAIWIVDTKKEHIAVGEARKLNIPVVAILDTNCDPDEVDYKIPGNDDAIRSIAVLTRVDRRRRRRGPHGPLRRAGQRRSRRGRRRAGHRWRRAAGRLGARAPDRWRRRCGPGRRRRHPAARGPRPRPPRSRPTRSPRRGRRPPPATTSTGTQGAQNGLIARRRPRHRRGRRRGARPNDPSHHHRPRGSDMAEFTAADVKRLRDATGAGMMDCKKALTEADGDYDKAVEFLRVKGAKDVGKRLERSTTNGVVVSKDGALLELDCETDFVAKNADFVEARRAPARHRPGREAGRRRGAAGHRGRRPDRRRAGRERVRPHRREARARAASPSSRAPPPPTCTSAPPTCPRPSVSRVQYSGGSEDAARSLAMHIAAARPRFLTREEVPAEAVETERRVAEQTAKEEGKPEQAIAEDRRGPGQRLSTRTSSCSSSRRSPSPSAR